MYVNIGRKGVGAKPQPMVLLCNVTTIKRGVGHGSMGAFIFWKVGFFWIFY
jgi:hypothetical protein